MKANNKNPSNWPSEIQYITSCHYHSSVLESARQFIRGSPATRGNVPEAYRSLVAIRLISHPSHPANGQRGLFAARKIPARTRILDYLGEIHCDDRPESNYDLSLYRTPDGTSVGIDASVMGNEARFINDYRGVASKPNAIFVDARVTSGELRMSIWSCDEIKKGEELVVSYGKSWWRARVDSNSEIVA